MEKNRQSLKKPQPAAVAALLRSKLTNDEFVALAEIFESDESDEQFQDAVMRHAREIDPRFGSTISIVMPVMQAAEIGLFDFLLKAGFAIRDPREEAPDRRCADGGCVSESCMHTDELEPEAHPRYITIAKGLRGLRDEPHYYAVELVWCNDDDLKGGGFYEPHQTGVGSYATYDEARPEAVSWAQAEGIEFRDEREPS